MSQWQTFFVAQVGASAALAGLVFVGVSINLDKVMKFPALLGQALEAVVVLAAILMISSLLLIPGQSRQAAGIEALTVGVTYCAMVAGIQWRVRQQVRERYRQIFVLRIGIGQAATLPFVEAGLVLLISGSAGLYWVAAGILVSFIVALFDAWVLLVEINR